MTLTREEILAMKPGGQLSALVAEIVMEYVWIAPKYAGEQGYWWDPKHSKEVFAFNPSKDISAAYELLVDKKSHQLTYSEAGFSHSDLKYRAIVGRNQDVAYAATAPEAICKARLLAVLNL